MPASTPASCATPKGAARRFGLDVRVDPRRARRAAHGRRPGRHDRRRRARPGPPPRRAAGRAQLRSMSATAHLDTFVRDRLPPREQWPVFYFDLPELRYPQRLNCASASARSRDADARARSQRIAERIGATASCARRSIDLRRAAEGPAPRPRQSRAAARREFADDVARWLAVVKAGGIVVATMPMLRTRELRHIVDTAQIGLALCDPELVGDLTRPRVRPAACSGS